MPTGLQTSTNLALGPALASIGLTEPAVVPAVVAAVVAAMVAAVVWLDLPLVLGLSAKVMAMPAMTFLVSAITLGSGAHAPDAGRRARGGVRCLCVLAFVP